jgi:hypothetical protein
MKEYKVYILRLIDEKTPKYVGITSGDLNKRLVKHMHDIKRESCKNKHKKNWLSKYRDSIIIEQIDTAVDIYDLKQKEILYIKKYKDIGIDLVNATNGGDGSYGFKHSEETIKKISGQNNHRYGKPNLHNKQILGNKVESSIDGGKTWVLHESIREASISTTTSCRTISYVCSGRYTKNRMGVIFRYFGHEYVGGINKIKKNQSIRKRPIECLLDDKWVSFLSAVDASIELGLNRVSIIDVCKGRRNHTGGYKFRYKEIC